MSQIKNTFSKYAQERDITKPCPNCGGKFVMVMKDSGKKTSWPVCNVCSFDGSPRYKGATDFEYENMTDEEHFKAAYEQWDTLTDFINEEMQLTGKTAKQVCEKEKKDPTEPIPMKNNFAG